MNEKKTQPSEARVEEFVTNIPDKVLRSEAERLLTLMTNVTGEKPVMWGDGIVGFGMYHYTTKSGREGDWMRVGFAPGKARLSLYGLKDHKESLRLLEHLGPHTAGVGCVYIKNLDDVNEDVLRALIALAHEREALANHN
ncbi:MAG: DUF1801 domain-containing protein [Demequinaceae bacterium]|nr:DUF1801 domain-containing protein [Demequinaceae bacterium]